MVLEHISIPLELSLIDTENKIKVAQDLYQKISHAHEVLELEDPSNPYLRLVIMEDGFPKPRKSFEKGYGSLISKSPSFTYLKAHEKYLVDLESQIKLLLLSKNK